MSLLNVVNVTVDALEKTASDLRGLEQVLVADVDEEARVYLADELARVRRVLETLTRELHAERRATRSVPTGDRKQGPA